MALSRIYVLNETGLLAMIDLKEGKVQIPLGENASLFGSAIVAHLLKLASEEKFLPLIKTDGNFLYYMKKYILIGRIAGNLSEEDVMLLERLHDYLSTEVERPEDVDTLISALLRFLERRA